MKMKKKYNGWKWITVKRRFQIYLRDNHECQYCTAHRDDFGVKLSLDHINSDLVKKRNGPGKDNSSENLITSCMKCNLKKMEKTIEEFTARHKEIREQAKKPLPDGDVALSYRYTKQQPLF